MMIEWVADYDNDTTDPQDGGEPFTYWWEDMRPREVKALVQRAYERGYERGLKERVDAQAHKAWVAIPGFGSEIMFNPVTVAGWLAAGLPLPGGLATFPTHMPIVLITQDEAAEFARRSEYRLPIDEELHVALDAHLVRRVHPVRYEWAAEYGLYRGGGWFNGPAIARASLRFRCEPASRLVDLGFRCARDVGVAE